MSVAINTNSAATNVSQNLGAMSRSNILVQAGSAMLSRANSSSQIAMNLFQ